MGKSNAGKASVFALIASLWVVSFLIGKTLTSAQAQTAPKWTVCHATASTSNPYVKIVVSSKSEGGHFDNNGNPTTAHSTDLLLDGDAECPENVVNITHQNIDCGTQNIHIVGTAAYNGSVERRLRVYLDSIEKLNSIDEPTSWDAGTYSLGVGVHTVYAKVTNTTGNNLKAEDTWTFTINACPVVLCGNGTIETGEQCDDGNLVNGDRCSSTCTIENTDETIYGCMDRSATNFDPKATEQGDVICTFASSTPDTDLCKNIDGIQTSVPDGLHLDAGKVNCVSYAVPGEQVGNGSSTNGAVLGASTSSSQGQVLGASTMAKTGSFTEFMNMIIMTLGGAFTAKGVKNLKKVNKKA